MEYATAVTLTNRCSVARGEDCCGDRFDLVLIEVQVAGCHFLLKVRGRRRTRDAG